MEQAVRPLAMQLLGGDCARMACVFVRCECASCSAKEALYVPCLVGKTGGSVTSLLLLIFLCPSTAQEPTEVDVYAAVRHRSCIMALLEFLLHCRPG